jgi:hypothetical protein
MRGYSDSDSTQRLTVFEVDSRKIDVFVTSKGDFKASIEDQDFRAPTLDALKTKLTKACRAKAVRVAVPATRRVGRDIYSGAGAVKLVDITLTGVHTRHGAILFRYDSDNRADSTSGYSRHEGFFRRMTESEKKELLDAYRAQKDAEKRVEILEQRFTIEPKEAIEEAIERGLPPEPEAPTGDPRIDPPARKRR